jgi:hypothetical protein
LIVKADGLKEDVLTVKEQEYLSEKRPDNEIVNEI